MFVSCVLCGAQVWDLVPAALHDAIEELVGDKDGDAVAEAEVGAACCLEGVCSCCLEPWHQDRH